MRKYFPRLLFFFNFIIVFILYYPARYGRFVHDFINWAYKYDQYSLADILKCRSDNSYHLFYQLFFYLACKLSHTNAVAWLTFFSVLHAATATMFFVLFKKIFEDNG